MRNKKGNGFTLFKKTIGREPSSRTGFTFIELLMAISLWAICFLPLMQMFSVSLREVGLTDDLTTARYLAQEEMEKIKNLSFTIQQLKSLGSGWQPSLEKPPVILNGKSFRILREIAESTDPLEIYIRVYREEDVQFHPTLKAKKIADEEFLAPRPRAEVKAKPIFEIATLISDFE